MDERAKLTLWFSYDRFCGMGKFLTAEGPQERPFFPPSTIVFDNSFLIRGRTEPLLCKFMEGYVQSVLENIFGDYTWEVKGRCPAGPHKECRFTIEHSELNPLVVNEDSQEDFIKGV